MTFYIWQCHTVPPGTKQFVGKMLAKEDNPDTRLEGFEPTTLGSED